MGACKSHSQFEISAISRSFVCSNYVNQSMAQSDGLVSSTATTFKMGADDKTVLDAKGNIREFHVLNI
jgi:hypothetical protein